MIDLMGNLHATKRMKQNNYSVTRKKKSLYDGLRVLQSPVILLDMTPCVKWQKKSESDVSRISMKMD